jgi:hypothetical protein
VLAPVVQGSDGVVWVLTARAQKARALGLIAAAQRTAVVSAKRPQPIDRLG